MYMNIILSANVRKFTFVKVDKNMEEKNSCLMNDLTYFFKITYLRYNIYNFKTFSRIFINIQNIQNFLNFDIFVKQKYHFIKNYTKIRHGIFEYSCNRENVLILVINSKNYKNYLLPNHSLNVEKKKF
jgi:hypothetical protein